MPTPINRQAFINSLKEIVADLETESRDSLSRSDLYRVSGVFGCGLERDNYGQIVIYTSMKDGDDNLVMELEEEDIDGEDNEEG